MRLSEEWVRKLHKKQSLDEASDQSVATVVASTNKNSPLINEDPEAMKRVTDLLENLFPNNPSDL